MNIGQKVRRTGSLEDYTTGRTGEIVELDQEKQRARVLWTAERSGRAIRDGKGLRTWVKFQYLEKVAA